MFELQRSPDHADVERDSDDEPHRVDIDEVQRVREGCDFVGDPVLSIVRFSPACVRGCDLPVGEIEESAVFDAVGFVDDPACVAIE